MSNSKQFTHNLEKAKRQAEAEREKIYKRNKLMKRYNSL